MIARTIAIGFGAAWTVFWVFNSIILLRLRDNTSRRTTQISMMVCVLVGIATFLYGCVWSR
jgi:hypothetical protein